MTFFRSSFGAMTPVDIVTLVFTCILAVLTAIFHTRLDTVAIYTNLTIVWIVVIAANYLRSRSSAKGVRMFHAFYIMPVIVFVFKTVEKLSYNIHGRDFDSVLIIIDRAFFAVDPTVWLATNFPLSPLGVEFYMLCYFMYYILFIILTWELFLRRKNHSEGGIHDNELETYRFSVVYGFLFSYIGYMILPSVGPRFTLHEFSQLPMEMPGLWMTDFFRYLIDSGENISKTMTSREAMKYVTRDAFPSGHTMMAFITMLLALKYKTRSRWVINFFGVGLIISTVLLRYHYVIDIAAGIIFALVALYTAPYVTRVLLSWNAKLTGNNNTR